MGAIYNGIETGNPIINGVEHYGFCNGVEVFGNDMEFYFLEGVSTTNHACNVYKSTTGEQGAFIRQIPANDWTLLAQYAPRTLAVSVYVALNWTGIGVPLDFSKAGYFHSLAFQGCTQFNQPFRCDSATWLGQGFFTNNNAFDQDISFDNLNIVVSGCNIPFRGCNGKKITFGKMIVPNQHDNILAGTNPITLEFQAVQTVTSLSNSFANGRLANIDLRIKTGSSNVNVANRTWAGRTFKSITLI